MPILIMALAALSVFLVIGGLLFVAGMTERRQATPEAKKPTVFDKVA